MNLLKGNCVNSAVETSVEWSDQDTTQRKSKADVVYVHISHQLVVQAYCRADPVKTF
jgi:hypothetical protein